MNVTFSIVIPPPVNVRATQSSSSASVEVSWSHPTQDQGAFKITGYRLFYARGENMFVSKIATSIGLGVNKSFDGQTVFIRSESDKLYYSELVNVTVGTGKLIT